MSSKPARVRKAANRVPTSLEIPTSLPLIKTVIPIDPQLLALDDTILANDKSDVLLDCVTASPKSKQSRMRQRATFGSQQRH